MPVINFQGQKIRFPDNMPAADIEEKLASIARIAQEVSEEPDPPLEILGVPEIAAALCDLAECSLQNQRAFTETIGTLIGSINDLVKASQAQHAEIMAALNKEPVHYEPETPSYEFHVERDEDGIMTNLTATPNRRIN